MKVKTICAIEIAKIHLVINVIIRVSYYISSNISACLISLTHNRQTIFALRGWGGGGGGGGTLLHMFGKDTMVFDPFRLV